MTRPRPARGPRSRCPARRPDRETAEGWTRWRLTRHGFAPAPVITLAE